MGVFHQPVRARHELGTALERIRALESPNELIDGEASKTRLRLERPRPEPVSESATAGLGWRSWGSARAAKDPSNPGGWGDGTPGNGN